VLVQEAEEIIPLNERYFARLHRLSGQPVRLATNRRAQTYRFPGLGDIQDERLAFFGADALFHPTLAKDKNSARRLLFYEDHGSAGKGARKLDPIKTLESDSPETAKEIGRSYLATAAAVHDFKTVRRAHDSPPDEARRGRNAPGCRALARPQIGDRKDRNRRIL
jgi:hypothetical protein